jgi:PAS domain S-box-containing protein
LQVEGAEGAAGRDPAFLSGGGEVAELIRRFDWSMTSLGSLDRWPQSLKSTTSTLLLSPVPIVLLWGVDGVMIYNDAYSAFAGARHPQLLGSKVREGWPEVADFNDNVMKVGLAGGTLAYRDQRLTLDRHGTPAPTWMNLDYSPVLDESGKPAGVIAIVVETTERVLAEQRLGESEARLRALVNATSDIIYSMSPDWREMWALDGRGFLTDTDAPSIAWMDAYLYEEDVPHILAAINEAIRDRRPFQLEHRVRQADGTAGWTFSRAIPLFDDKGAIVEWFGAASDVTERHRAEERLRLLVNELNHRVKNNLAMTQAIATQTFRNAENLEQARERFIGRVIALGRANDFLTGDRGASASLRGVLEQAMQPHREEEARWQFDGPDIDLSAKTALALTLALHELATNALKYGAWSVPDGRVFVTSQVQSVDGRQRLHIEWRERGGPRVQPPATRGFGSRLIEHGLAAEMGGTVTMHFEPDGMVCTVDAPIDPLEDGR